MRALVAPIDRRSGRALTPATEPFRMMRRHRSGRKAFCTVKSSLLHDVEEFVEMLLRDLSQRSKFSNAGVSEDDIDSPLALTLVKTIQVRQLATSP